MSFSTAAKDVSIEKRSQEGYSAWFLIATLQTGGLSGGEGVGWNRHSLCLDDFLANDHGGLKWETQGRFSISAENADLVVEPDPNAPKHVLRAKLYEGSGGKYNESYIDLNEKIANNHGLLAFK